MLYFWRKRFLTSHGHMQHERTCMSEPNKKNPFFKFLSQDHHIPQTKQKKITTNQIKIPKEISGGRRVEETYRMLERAVEQSIDGIAMADMDGIIQFCNRAWAKMHGYHIYELLGKHLSIFHTREQLDRDVVPFNEQVKKTGAYHGEVGHLRKDGTTFLTWMSTTILKDERGNPIGLVGIARDITKRKQTEEALAISEEKYRKLFKNSIEGIGIYKMDRFITANKTLLDIFGYETLQEFIKVPFTYHVALESRKMFKERMRKRQRGESLALRYEYKIIRRDGQLRDIEASTTEILIGDEKYVQGTFRDITERKYAEEELRKNKEKYKTLTQNINVGLYRNTAGAKGRFIEANPAVVKMFGYGSKEEFLSMRVCDLYWRPEDRERFSKKLSDCGFLRNEEALFKKKDGTTFIGSVSAVAVKDENGQVEYFDGIVEDITERKKVEKALRDSKDFLSGVFESIQDGISVLDTDFTIRSVNKTMEKWYAGNAPLVGKKCFECYHNRNKPCYPCPTVRCLESGQTEKEIVRGLFGSEVEWIELFSYPIKERNTGKVTGVVEFVRDITERKKAEEQQTVVTGGLRAVVEIADRLIACPDLDSLFLRAVELGREKLDLERCAIFVEDSGYMQGYYGTDRYGRTTDEHALRFEKNECWAKHLRKLVPDDPKWIMVEEPRLEWDGEKTVQIDKGWIVLTPIQSAQRPIGVFVNDAAISKLAVDEIKQDTVAVFCSLLGNIAERKRAEKELSTLNKELFKTNKRFKQLAFRDSHTGLYNHRYLQEAIESEFSRAKRYNYPFSIIMLDLDYFKSINDAYSHQFGDLILKQFARQIKRMVRKYDIVIRFGGEEFLIISPGMDKTTTTNLAQRILDTITSAKFGNDEYNVRLKLSVAVSSYPENKAAKGMDLIELVDRILNKAKENGGNRVYSSTDTKGKKHSILESSDESPDVKFLRTKINRLNERANQSLIESVFAFARTIKLKDQYTGEHVENTVHFATEIANKLGLSKNDIEHVKRASTLHDLGKIGISERILLKKSKLTSGEFNHIKKHPQIGADILRPIHFLHGIIPLILYHHERWDGKGYPRGLKREEIPLGARIVAISDVYQALISDRPYRKAFVRDKAREIIQEGSGTQFDPEIVDLFLKVID